MHHSRTLTLCLVLLCLTSAVAQQPILPRPSVLAVYPAGGKAGETIEVEITENFELEHADGLIFSHPGITAKPVMTKPDRFYPETRPVPNTFTVAIAANTPPGVYELRATVGAAISNARRFVVGDLPETRETEDNNTPEKANSVDLGSTVNGLFSNDYDYFRFSAKKGQRAVIHCRSQRIDSRGDPVLLLLDATGRELAVNHDAQGLDSVLDFQAPADGDYLLRIHELTFTVGGGNNTAPYRITLADRPWIDFIDPPVIERGKTATRTIYGSNLGGQPSDVVLDGRRLEKLDVSVTAPGDAESVTDPAIAQSITEAEVDTFFYRHSSLGGVSNPVRLALSDGPLVLEAEPNDRLEQAQAVQPPLEISARFDKSGDVDGYVFDAKKDEMFWIEADSERLGQPTDVLLVVQRLRTDGEGKTTAQDLNVTDDPRLQVQGMNFRLPLMTTDPSWLLKVPEDGRYRVLIRDQFDTVGSGRPTFYRLKIRPPHAGFRLLAAPDVELNPDNNNNQVLQPRAAVARRGGSVEFFVFAYRQEGFDGEIELRVEGLPNGASADPAIIGPDMHWTSVVVRAEQNATAWNGAIRITGRAKIADRDVSRPARPVEMLWQPQGNDPTPVRLAESLTLAIDDKMPLPARIEAQTQTLRMARGGKISLPLKLMKQTDWTGNATVALVGLPQRITKNAANVSTEGKEAKIDLDIQQDAVAGRYTVFLRGEAEIDFRRRADLQDRAQADRDRINKVKQELEQEYQQAIRDRQTAEQKHQQAGQTQNNLTNEKNQASQTAQQTAQQSQQATQQAQQAQRNLDEAAKRKIEAEAALKSAADENAKNQAQNNLNQVAQQVQQAQTALDNANQQAKEATDRAKQAADKLSEAEQKLTAAIEANKQADAAKRLAMEKENDARVARDQGEQIRQQAERDFQQAQNIARQRKIKVPVHSQPVVLEIVDFPAQVQLNSEKFVIQAGKTAEIVAKAAREFEFKDQIEFLIQPPSGVGGWSLSPNPRIEANQNEGKFEFRIDQNAKPGDYEAELLIRMRFNNRQLDERRKILVSITQAERAK